MNVLKNITQSWKTTTIGIVGAIATIGTVLMKAGITVGHWGTGDCVAAVTGIAVAVVGALTSEVVKAAPSNDTK